MKLYLLLSSIEISTFWEYKRSGENMINKELSREEREKKHFEDFASDEGYIWWGGRTPAAKLRFERRRDVIKEYLNFKNGEKILELGSGSGDFTEYIFEAKENKNLSITGIELSKGQISVAQQRLNSPNINFVVGSINEMPFTDNTFDYVMGNSVLHHLELDKALKEVNRVLKPGGKIMFFEPNLFNPLVWVLFKIPPFRKLHGASPDEMAFYKWDINAELLKFGFKNIITKPFDFMFPLIPPALFNVTKSVEKLVEKTPINEIGGSLIITAEK